ncbi:MAG: hypothetical protein ABGX27_01035 [Desulfurobacteriaceae bacterium]
MSCFNFGKEDELFPFEENANRWIEGISPDWKVNRDYKIPTKQREVEKRLLKFKRLFYGSEFEEKVNYIIYLNSRITSKSEKGKCFFFIVENYLFPFLEKLIYYQTNYPEGEEELNFLLKEIEKDLSLTQLKNFEDKINRTFDILISALYQQID